MKPTSERVVDERIRKLFVKRMGLILDKRKNDAAVAATRVRQEMNRRGMLHSSGTELGVKRAYQENYEEICQEAWSGLQQIAVTIGVTPDERLADELRAVFDHVMEPLAKRYVDALARQRSTTGAIAGDIAGDAEAAFRRSRDIVGTAIELFSIDTERMDSQSVGNIHIHHSTFSGPVGAVQQGDRATATVTQNIDAAGLEALRSALESLFEKCRDHEQLAPLIEEAKAEAGKPQPGSGHIRNLLREIKAGLSLAKEGKELFEAVENAGLECGIDAVAPTRLQIASKRTVSDRSTEKNEQGRADECPSPNNEDGDMDLGNDDRPQQPVGTEKAPMRRSDVWKHLTWQRAGVVAALLSAIVAVLVLLFGTNVVGRLVGVNVADGVRNDTKQTESPVGKPQLYATYSFKKAPFVHPKIINEFVGHLSDVGDQVIAINLLDSQDSNRYFGEISVAPQEDPMVPSWPWVYTVEGEESRPMDLGELWGVPWYAYRWVALTQSGLDVLHVRGSGGGTGIFNWVVFTRIEVDQGAEYPLSRYVESRTETVPSEIRVRELLRFVGRIPLGDRWLGTVEVNGNDVVVRGRDLYERCEVGGVTTMEVVEMAEFEGKDCRSGPPDDPPHARVYEAPAP